MKDVDGYQLDVAVQVQVRELGDTVAMDKPGFMSAIFKMGLGVTVINKTPGRNLTFKGVDGVTKPYGSPKFLVNALYEKGSPVCLAGGRTETRCGILLGYGLADVAFPAASTTSLKTYTGDPSGNLSSGIAAIPEADWPAVKEALMKPAAFAVGYEGGDYKRFDCPLDGKLGVMVASDPAGVVCGSEGESDRIEMVRHPAR